MGPGRVLTPCWVRARVLEGCSQEAASVSEARELSAVRAQELEDLALPKEEALAAAATLARGCTPQLPGVWQPEHFSAAPELWGGLKESRGR